MSVWTLFKAEDFTGFIRSGFTDYNNTEEVRKGYLINMFTFVALFFLLPLGINALLESFYPTAFALLFVSTILIINHIYLKLTHNQILASYVISTLFFFLMTYLIYTGGIYNTGVLWIYSLPLIIMFLLGFKVGLFYILLFIILNCIILFSPIEGLLQASYTFEYKVRIILALLVITFLASVYEYLREVSFETMSEMSKQLEEVSNQDYLTKVYNRRGIHHSLEHACKMYKQDNKNFSLMICDIDHFKNINDTFGHNMGDTVLKRVADEIKSVLREKDVIARWGGEEFLILLPGLTIEDAHDIGERIRKSIENIVFSFDDKLISITVSIGLSQKQKEKNIEHIISQADQHMYEAKSKGRNTIFPSPEKG